MNTTGNKILNFIVNPNAGRGKATRAMKKIAAYLDRQKLVHKIHFADTSEQARDIARGLERAGEDTIIAVGGDGTFSEVINGVRNLSGVTFGFIPAGTGNDLVKTLDLPCKPLLALKHILSDKTDTIDYLQGKCRRALNIVSTGFDVDVLKRFNASGIRNKLTYYHSLLKCILKFDYYKSDITLDGKDPVRREFFLVAATNGRYFGSGMHISPNAGIQDGKINTIVINSMPKSRVFRAALRFIKGKHIHDDYVEEYLTDHIVLDTGKRMTLDFDGELIEDEFDIKIVPNGLKIFFDPDLASKRV